MESKNIDIVLCIDVTASLRPIIDYVSYNALTFYQEFTDEMGKNGKGVARLRVKIIAFKDYACDLDAMVQSPFFVLPEQDKEYKKYVDGLVAWGGGDLPENALEALAFALKSDWSEGSEHKIALFTDSSALPFGERADSPDYPEGMPADLNEFKLWWEGKSDKCSFKPEGSTLLIYAPEVYPWDEMRSWDRVYVKTEMCVYVPYMEDLIKDLCKGD